MTFAELDKLKKTTEDVLKLAKDRGASQVDVHAGIEDGFAVTVRRGDLDTVEYHRDKGISITVYFGKRKGSVATSDTSSKSINEAVAAACNIAKFTQEDECAGLADQSLMAENIIDLELYHDWDMNPEKAIDLALEHEAYACSLDKRIKQSEGVSVSSHKSFMLYGNSHGFIGAVPSTHHSMSCALIAEAAGKMERDYDYTVSCDATKLDSFKGVAKKTVEKAVGRLGAQKIETKKAPVVFASTVAKGLLATFMAAISGNNLYRKTSFLVDHLGKQVFAKHLKIHENPFVIGSLGSSAFDAEGVATRKKDFVTDGILQSYVLGSYSARKLGMQTTANADGVHNLFIEDHGLSLAELLKKMGTGLFVTELIGQGVNIVTGDYSRGAVGFWVENGLIQYPVSEITIAGNLKDMFLNLVAVGNDFDQRGNIHAGSILLEEMMIAGN